MTVIPPLTFNVWISIVFRDIQSAPGLSPVSQAQLGLLCPGLDLLHCRKAASRGRCWLTFWKTAHCLISALLKTYREIIFVQSKQSEWEHGLKFAKIVSLCLLPSHLPKGINKTGQLVLLHTSAEPLADPLQGWVQGNRVWLSNFSISLRFLCESSIHGEPKEGENKNLFTLSLSS